MPCSTCGTPLWVAHYQRSLYCPECHDIDVVDPTEVQGEIEQTRQMVSEDRVMSLLEAYDKSHLILVLVNEVNRVCHAFYDDFETGLNVEKFVYTSYLLRLIYERDDFGDKKFDNPTELPEELDRIYKWVNKLVRHLDSVEDGFRYAVAPENYYLEPNSFLSKYLFFDSEYSYCFLRCLESIIGGDEDDVEYFLKSREEAQKFETKEVDEIDSLEDSTKTFFEGTVIFAFMMSAERIANDIYYTSLPDSVDTFQLKQFFDCIDSQYSGNELDFINDTGTLTVTRDFVVEDCAKNAFGNDWESVVEKMVVSEDNLDAHPYLFRVMREEVVAKQLRMPPITVELPNVLYPRYYSRLIRYQIFPLLTNGDAPSGKELLEAECESRGKQYEWNIYKIFDNRDYECYYSAEFTQEDQREIDTIVINQEDDEIWFIESKYLLPELGMRTTEGIKSLNNKFDSKVFNQDTETHDAEGREPFPEKVNTWLDEKPGEDFTYHTKKGQEGRDRREFPEEWTDLEPKMYVISNLVPSYIEKQGVQFLTDVELLRMLDDEFELYTKKA